MRLLTKKSDFYESHFILSYSINRNIYFFTLIEQTFQNIPDIILIFRIY